MISNLIIPSIVLFIIIYGFKKRINIYDEFLIGVKEGLEISLKSPSSSRNIPSTRCITISAR